MPELSAAPSINDSRTQALLVLIERLGLLDLTTLLVYRIDSVVETAIPFLAWQFDILSPLWQLIAPVSLGVDALSNIDLLIDVDNLIEGGGLVSAQILSEAEQRELLDERDSAASISRHAVGDQAGARVAGMELSHSAGRAIDLGRRRVSVEPGMGRVPRDDRSRGRAGRLVRCAHRRRWPRLISSSRSARGSTRSGS